MELTHDDIRTINQARRIFKRVAGEAMSDSWAASQSPSGSPNPAGLGRFAEAADQAGDACFTALNVGNAYCDFNIPDALLFDREEP